MASVSSPRCCDRSWRRERAAPGHWRQLMSGTAGQDTVAEAAATPDRIQPYAALGLTAGEYASIAGVLGRRPTDAELAIYSVMWSEHCSYKSSRLHLRQFGEKAPDTCVLLAGIGQNAGVVDIGQGYAVVLVGSRTGPDGIGGASVLASASFGGSAAGGRGEGAKRPSVQVGDPFMEKLLVECCLELYAADLVVGIQDLGAAGVACATTELAAGGKSGMTVRLDAVPLRDASLGPAEILMSESQERMMAVVRP